MIPDFGADEEIFALDVAVFLEEIADCASNLFFILVEPSTVEVAEERTTVSKCRVSGRQ